MGASSEGLCSRRTWSRKAQRMRCSGGAGARAFRALAQLDGRCRGRWIRRQKKLLVSICMALAQCGGTRSKDRGAATRRGMMQRGPEQTLGVQRLEMAATTQLWRRSSGWQRLERQRLRQAATWGVPATPAKLERLVDFACARREHCEHETWVDLRRNTERFKLAFGSLWYSHCDYWLS